MGGLYTMDCQPEVGPLRSTVALRCSRHKVGVFQARMNFLADTRGKDTPFFHFPFNSFA